MGVLPRPPSMKWLCAVWLRRIMTHLLLQKNAMDVCIVLMRSRDIAVCNLDVHGLKSFQFFSNLVLLPQPNDPVRARIKAIVFCESVLNTHVILEPRMAIIAEKVTQQFVLW